MNSFHYPLFPMFLFIEHFNDLCKFNVGELSKKNVNQFYLLNIIYIPESFNTNISHQLHNNLS